MTLLFKEFINKLPITEGIVGPEISLTLDQILASGGKVSNFYQVFVVAKLVQSIHNGTLAKCTDLNELTADKANINLIKSLQPPQLVALVSNLKSILLAYKNNTAGHPHMSLQDFIWYVIKGQE